MQTIGSQQQKRNKRIPGLAFFDGYYSQAFYTHVLVQGPPVLYPYFQCYHEQKSFSVTSQIFTFQRQF